MRSPSSTSGSTSLRGAALLLSGMVAIGAAACGGGTDVTAPTLSIALAGSGRGTVTGTPGSINCTNASGSTSGTCEAELEDGAEVTLSATAELGSTFVGWSGDDVTCGANTPCAMTVSDSRTVTATFDAAAATQTLTLVGGGAGTGSGRVVSEPAGIDCTITSGTEAAAGCSGTFPTGVPVQLQVQAGSLVGWGGACSGTTCSVLMDGAKTVIATFTADAQATQLAFVGQPGAVQVGTPIAPPVQVAVLDAAGLPVPGRTDAITLRIAANPGSATLGGQITRSAENGVATFSDLTLSQIGSGYTLAASASGLPEVTSEPFNVTAGAVAQLAFAVQPAASTVAGVPFTPAIQVRIQDASGALLTGRSDQITISLRNNPAGGTLSGTRTVTAVAGVATFSNLTLQKACTGYTLGARAQDASGATSNAFTIVAGAPRQLVIASVQSQQAPAGTAVPVRPSVKVMDAFNNPVEGVAVTWAVTDGDGSVVASPENPATRPTGPLGLSTVVSWTLGLEVGTGNNQLQASVTGLTGSPVTFTASGTLPAGSSAFTGVLREIENVGFLDPVVPISGATVKFFNLNSAGALAGTVTSNANGSFVSPPLPGGNEYRIEVTANDYKAITFQKPSPDPGVSFDLGPLGMVPFSNAQGTAGIGFSVNLTDEPTERVEVRVDVFSGYYVGETDENLIEEQVIEDNVEVIDDQEVINNSIQIFLDLNDWGILTVRVSAPGYATQTITGVVIDDPTDIISIPDVDLVPAE